MALHPSAYIVRDPNKPGDSEPPISLYHKLPTIQPIQIMGSSEGITSFDSVVKTAIGTSAVAVSSSIAVKKATLRVRTSTGSYVAVGGVNRQEVRLATNQSMDLWCSNLDQVFVKAESGSTSIVEVAYGY